MANPIGIHSYDHGPAFHKEQQHAATRQLDPEPKPPHKKDEKPPTGMTSSDLGMILSSTDDQGLIDKIMNNLDNPVLIREIVAEFQAKAAAEKRTKEEASNDKQPSPNAKNTKKLKKKNKSASGRQAGRQEIAKNKEHPPRCYQSLRRSIKVPPGT